MSEHDQFEHAKSNAKGWLSSIEEMLAAIDKAGDSRAEESARQAIEESPLSVMVRDGWRQPGTTSDGAEEYEILLATGGPALRIWGRLGQHNEPNTAELQMRDWGTPWTRFPAAEETLLRFACCFYFDE